MIFYYEIFLIYKALSLCSCISFLSRQSNQVKFKKKNAKQNNEHFLYENSHLSLSYQITDKFVYESRYYFC